MRYSICISVCFLVCNSTAEAVDTGKPTRLIAVAGVSTGMYVSGLAYLGLVWYKDRESVPFHTYHDHQGWLQLDKAGHAFSSYHLSLAHYKAFSWAGVRHKKAVVLAVAASTLYMTPIEIFDGLYKGYGFSWSDVVANTSGTLLFTGQALLWEEQRIRMKFSYSPSIYPPYRSGTLGSTSTGSFFRDYNAHSYWLSANLNAFGLNTAPAWLNIAAGYSGEGMLGEFENPSYYRGERLPHFDRSRQWLISADIDFSRIPTKKPWLKAIFKGLNLVKLPFPAIELNSDTGFEWHWIYF